MKIHVGGFANPGFLKFETGTLGFNNSDGVRELHAQTLERTISRAYGVSFGTKLFIGVLVLTGERHGRQRIK